MACRNGALAVDDLGLPALVVLLKGRFAFKKTLLGICGGRVGNETDRVGLGCGCGVFARTKCSDGLRGGLVRNSLGVTRMPVRKCLSVEVLAVAQLLCGSRLMRYAMTTECRPTLRT